MGRWFARFFVNEGKQVTITGRNEEKLRSAQQELGVQIASNTGAVSNADIIIISVPIDNFEQVISQIAPYTNLGQLIIDITSLKVRPVEIMHNYFKAENILGTHPVFGPGATGIKGQNFILTPTSNEETALANKVRTFLETKGANVSLMTPREHDEMMSVVLGLAHFISIVAADTLLGFEKFNEMKRVGGTTFKLLYTLIESVISEDPQLYASLQMNFPDIVKVEQLFQQNTMKWAEIVRKNNIQGFVDNMSALRNKLEQTDPNFQQAYKNMYRLTDGI